MNSPQSVKPDQVVPLYVRNRQWYLIKATGASTLQVLRYGVVPQVIPPFLSFTIYRWDINVRMSTIIGFVGGGGIGYILKPRVDLGQWGEVGTLVILIATTVWAMDILSARIREKIV